jgi:thiol:disulfide interchange protein/DsbC/DsbD-like thiol-disulfide interchange protein
MIVNANLYFKRTQARPVRRTLALWLRDAQLALVALAALVASPSQATTRVKTDQVSAELLAHAPEGVQPGQSFALALKITHAPHWHTYWKNAGDSGLATSLDWTLPQGLSASGIDWPTPNKLPVGPLMNHGYEGTVLLPVTVNVAADAKLEASVPIQLHAQWLVCKEICIPQEGRFEFRLPTQAATAVHARAFEQAKLASPLPASASVAASAQIASTLNLRVQGLPASWQGQVLTVFPEELGVLAYAAPPQTRWDGTTWLAALPLSPERFESPTRMHLVLVRAGERALRVGVSVNGAWPALGGAATPSVTSSAPPPSPNEPALGWWVAMAWAFVGGLLLNLMPCVLPVLSFKVLGITAHTTRSARVGAGLAYTAGVVVSFVALASIVLALRASGQAVGWGFQLQSPGFVVALAVLFTLIGLNLAGLFELNLVLPGDVASARAQHPWVDAALTGVLAVAVAAPCTAPFMGAALGVAVQMPPAQALSVFVALGLGMAAPYLLVTLVPAVARWLPKPGPWMARFKGLMAFAMFATVVWLVWVLGQQTGMDGVAGVLALLVAVAFAVWALGQRQVRAGVGLTRASAWWPAAAIGVLAAVTWWAWPSWQGMDAASVSAFSRAPAAATEAGPAARLATATKAHGAQDAWEPWSPQRMAEHQQAGRTVFVDYTAAWCVSCQVNKRTTLNRADVEAAFEKAQVVRMRADWTRRDAVIAAELTRLNRTGVPVYAIYRPGVRTPTLLPELLTPSLVVDALAQHAKQP